MGWGDMCLGWERKSKYVEYLVRHHLEHRERDRRSLEYVIAT